MERRANNTKIPSLSRRRLAKRQAPVIEEQARANLEPAEHFSNDSGFGGDLLSCDNPEVLLPLYRLIRRPSNEGSTSSSTPTVDVEEDNRSSQMPYQQKPTLQGIYSSMLTDTDYAPTKRARRSYNSESNSPESPCSVESPSCKKEMCDDSIFNFQVPSTPTEYGSEFEQSNASSIDSSPVQRKVATKRRRRMHSESMGTCRNASQLRGNHPSCSRDGRLQLKILNQPERQHRARYLTEGSRGAVKDRQGEGYPVVKLIGPYDNPVTLQVFIANDEGKVVTPHMFYQACKIHGKNASRCQEAKVDGTSVIEIQMDSAADALSCDCVGILKERNVDVEARFGHMNGNSRKRSTRSRMVFRTTIHNSDGSSELLQVVSDSILCTQPPGVPEVQKISLEYSPVTGGSVLFIIGKNFAKDSEVVFREVDDSTEEYITKWEETVQPDKDYVNQSHLLCQVPPYRDIKVTHSVCIQLLVLCCGKLSDPHEFTYEPLKPANEEQAVVAPTLPKGVALPALEINRRFAETGEVPKTLSLEMSKTLSQRPIMTNTTTLVVSQQSPHLDSGTATAVASGTIPYSVQLLKPSAATDGNQNSLNQSNGKILQSQFNTAIENSREVPLLVQWQEKTSNETPQNAPHCLIADLGSNKAPLGSQNNFPPILYTVQPSGDTGSSVALGSQSMMCKVEQPQSSPMNDPDPISPLSHTSISRTRKHSSIYSPSPMSEDHEIMEGSSPKMLNFSISGQITVSCPDDHEQKEMKFSFNTDTKYTDVRGKTLEQVMTEEIKKSLKPIVTELTNPDSILENSSDAQSPFTSKDNDELKKKPSKSEIEELREQLKNLTDVVHSLKTKTEEQPKLRGSFPTKVECNPGYLVKNFPRQVNSDSCNFRAPEILLDTAMDALDPPIPMASGMATSFRDSIVQKTLASRASTQDGHLPIFNLGASPKASLNSALPVLRISSSNPSTSIVNGSKANCQSVSAPQQAPILFVSTNATQNIVSANAMQNMIPANAMQNMVSANTTQNIVPANATQNMLSTNVNQSIVPTNAAQNIVPTNAAQNVVPTNATQSIVPTNAAQNIAPSNAAQNIVPTNATQNILPTNTAQNIVPTETVESCFNRTDLQDNLFNGSDFPAAKAALLNNLNATNSQALLLELSKATNTTPFYTNTMKAPVLTPTKAVNGIHHTCPPAIFDTQSISTGKKIMGDVNSFIGILNKEDNRLSERNIHILGQKVPSAPSPNEWTAKRKYNWGEVIKHEAPSQQAIIKKSLPPQQQQEHSTINQAAFTLDQLQPAVNNNGLFMEKEPIKTPELRYPIYLDIARQNIPDNNPKLSSEDPLLSSTLIVDNAPNSQATNCSEGDKLQSLMASDVMNFLNTVCSSGQDDKKAQS